MRAQLPIQQVLPQVLAALRDHSAVVLVAPPGAGKTTAVAPTLLDQPWCEGQVILTSPRRVAARAAAERMAEQLGESVGGTIGYVTRLDSRTSQETRVLVMTEAIFVNRILDDPELDGVSAVLFDEAHERSLDSDLGLALALDSRSVLREDLRVLVMSATIDGARFARLMGPATPVVESEGRDYPLAVRWLGAAPQSRLDEAMVTAVLTAWREEEGDILAFLPGVREIERTRAALAERLPDVPLLPLHGQVSPEEQRAALRPDAAGSRRIVLATSIAETSLTLDGVSVVIDSGLSRRAEFDQAAGTSHLVTVQASQASAVQRAGRAARQGPGTVYRLWNEAGHAGRRPFDPPEIQTADLAPLVLALANWGTSDPASLPWLDPPPAASVNAARERLEKLGALDEDGRITPFGRSVAGLPLDPLSAAAVLYGARAGQALDAAKLVLLLQERGLGGPGEDLLVRLRRWDGERGQRAAAARKLAANWARLAEKEVARIAARRAGAKAPLPRVENPAVFLALAHPDNIARRRDTSGEYWLSAGGRGFLLDPASPLAGAEWLVIGDAQGQARGARITAGAALTAEDVDDHLGHLVQRRSVLNWNESEVRIEARLERRLGAIVLASGPDPRPDREALVAMLVEKAVERLGTLLPSELLARARFAGVEELSETGLRGSVDSWLAPLLQERRDLAITPAQLEEALLSQLAWVSRQRLDAEAPREFQSPAGTRHLIDYSGDDAPSVAVRVQALFGLERHPHIGQTPLLLKLTSPAGRPIQSTRDLPGFWRGSWADVRKEMKGRYPKHRWPEEPWAEKPSLKTRNAFAKGGR